MDIELRFFATFREAVGEKSFTESFDDGASVGDVLRMLDEEYPDLELFEDGGLRDYLSVMRNGRDIAHLDGLETPLADGDRLSVFPPVAGG